MRLNGHGSQSVLYRCLQGRRYEIWRAHVFTTVTNPRKRVVEVSWYSFVARLFYSISPFRSDIVERHVAPTCLQEHPSGCSQHPQCSPPNIGVWPRRVDSKRKVNYIFNDQQLSGEKPISKTKIAKWDKNKRHSLLVNRLLKDKGETSYAWETPFSLLLDKYQAHIASHASKDSSDRTLSVEADQNRELAEDHRDRFPIRPIEVQNPENCRLARDIPIPKVWSTPALENYINDMTRSPLHQDRMPEISQIHGKGSSNMVDVVRALNSIFNSPALARYSSTKAYNLALKFFYEYNFVPEATALFLKMENSMIAIPTKTFNIMLRGAARHRDLHTFIFILHKAIARGLEPDGETWKLLLMVSPSQNVRMLLTQYLRERDITNHLPNSQGLSGLMIRVEKAFHDDMGRGGRSFLEHLDKQYGANWASRITCNNLLHEFSRRYGVLQALDLLPGLKTRGFTPDAVSLLSLLHLCARLKRYRNAIKTLQAFEYHFRLQPGRLAYETLFRMAWRDKHVHFAKVIWTSARIRGQVTFKMRNIVAYGPRSHLYRRIKACKFESRYILSGIKPASSVQTRLRRLLKPGRHRSVIEAARLRLLNYKQDPERGVAPANIGKLLFQAHRLDLKCVFERRSREITIQEMLQDAAELDIGVLLIAEQYIMETAKSYNTIHGSTQSNSESLESRTPTSHEKPGLPLVEALEAKNSTLSRESARHSQEPQYQKLRKIPSTYNGPSPRRWLVDQNPHLGDPVLRPTLFRRAFGSMPNTSPERRSRPAKKLLPIQSRTGHSSASPVPRAARPHHIDKDSSRIPSRPLKSFSKRFTGPVRKGADKDTIGKLPEKLPPLESCTGYSSFAPPMREAARPDRIDNVPPWLPSQPRKLISKKSTLPTHKTANKSTARKAAGENSLAADMYKAATGKNKLLTRQNSKRLILSATRQNITEDRSLLRTRLRRCFLPLDHNGQYRRKKSSLGKNIFFLPTSPEVNKSVQPGRTTYPSSRGSTHPAGSKLYFQSVPTIRKQSIPTFRKQSILPIRKHATSPFRKQSIHPIRIRKHSIFRVKTRFRSPGLRNPLHDPSAKISPASVDAIDHSRDSSREPQDPLIQRTQSPVTRIRRKTAPLAIKRTVLYRIRKHATRIMPATVLKKHVTKDDRSISNPQLQPALRKPTPAITNSPRVSRGRRRRLYIRKHSHPRKRKYASRPSRRFRARQYKNNETARLHGLLDSVLSLESRGNA